MLPEFHLTEDTFTLKLLLQRTERLIDVVVADQYLHLFTTFLKVSGLQEAVYIRVSVRYVQQQRNRESSMADTHRTEDEHIDAARQEVIEAALPHVVFDGWSQATLDAAVADTGTDAGLAKLAFPRGGIDLAVGFHRLMDDRMVEKLAAADLEAMRIRERVTFAVRTRIELVAGHREAVRRGATLMALPMHVADGARCVWETADKIWKALGDPSEDYNWYTKRMILGSVYSATVLFWLGDESPDYARTWDFLDRRIDDVMQFEKTKARMAANPVVRAAMWGPTQLLSMIRAPGTGRGGPTSGW